MMKFRLLAVSAAVALSALSMSAAADEGKGDHRVFSLSSPDLASGTFDNQFILVTTRPLGHRVFLT